MSTKTPEEHTAFIEGMWRLVDAGIVDEDRWRAALGEPISDLVEKLRAAHSGDARVMDTLDRVERVWAMALARGRRPHPPKAIPRTERFQLLLSRQEREKLDEMARSAGLDRSTLIRLRLFGAQLTMMPSSPPKATAPELRIFIFSRPGRTHVVIARSEDQGIELCGIEPRGEERHHWEVTVHHAGRWPPGDHEHPLRTDPVMQARFRADFADNADARSMALGVLEARECALTVGLFADWERLCVWLDEHHDDLEHPSIRELGLYYLPCPTPAIVDIHACVKWRVMGPGSVGRQRLGWSWAPHKWTPADDIHRGWHHSFVHGRPDGLDASFFDPDPESGAERSCGRILWPRDVRYLPGMGGVGSVDLPHRRAAPSLSNAVTREIRQRLEHPRLRWPDDITRTWNESHTLILIRSGQTMTEPKPDDSYVYRRYQEERAAKLHEQAKAEYAQHQIRKRSEGRWLLQKPHVEGGWRSEFFTEVISLAGGALYVGGDIGHVIFAYYGDKPANHEAKMRWMGEHSDFGYYVHQKACIGTGSEAINTYEAEAGRQQLLDWRQDYLQQLADEREAFGEDDDDEREPVLDTIAGLLDWQPDDPSVVMHTLYDECPNFMQDRYEFGTVIAPRLFFAHAALRRLCALLDTERQGARAS